MSSHCHNASRHVLVTAREGDASIMMLRTGYCLDRLKSAGFPLADANGPSNLDAVGDYLTGLKRKPHTYSSQTIHAGLDSERTLSAHCNRIGNTDCVVLPC